MNWCEKHDHFKRTCPWCEIEILQERLGDIDTPAEKLQRMEDEISALKDKLSGLKKEKYQLVMQVVERNAEIAELKEENERLQREIKRYAELEKALRERGRRNGRRKND